MAKPQGTELQESIELEADGGALKSQRREDGDAAAFEQAGKIPVTRVRPDLVLMP